MDDLSKSGRFAKLTRISPPVGRKKFPSDHIVVTGISHHSHNVDSAALQPIYKPLLAISQIMNLWRAV